MANGDERVAAYPRDIGLPSPAEFLKICEFYDGATKFVLLAGFNLFVPILLLLMFGELGGGWSAGWLTLAVFIFVEALVGFGAHRINQGLARVATSEIGLVRVTALTSIVPVVGLICAGLLHNAVSSKMSRYKVSSLLVGLPKSKRDEVYAKLVEQESEAPDMSKPPTAR